MHFNTIWTGVFFVVFLNIEQLRKEMTSKQGRFMVHSDAIWIHLLEVEKTLKAKTPTGNFWHYLKRFLWRLNCWEKIKYKFAIWNDVFIFHLCHIPHTHIFIAFWHLKVIYYFDFEFKSLLERVNEYATLRACCFILNTTALKSVFTDRFLKLKSHCSDAFIYQW